MYLKFLLTSLLSVELFCAPPAQESPSYPFATEIADQSGISILSPDFSERKTAKLRLSNGLELLLISDPNADLSAASITVAAGSWNDPPEFPGMAHFCEHMLFMGTQKYPDENGFIASVADHGGLTNAMTGSARTTYLFSASHEAFTSLFDQFAHFFIDPLFKPSNISREMHAVDQEFSKNIENDGWRMAMIFKETGNPDHPNRMFNCGNSETLSHIPQEALIRWHKQHYDANRMHAVIYSSLSIETLKRSAIASLQSVPESSDAVTESSLPLTAPEQKGHIAYIKPVQNKQSLILLWELPPALSDDPTQSADLIAYAIRRGQKNSLYEKLKKEQWIEDLAIEVEQFGDRRHRFFEISLDLTEKGMENAHTAILTVFQTLAALHETGVPNYLFQEKNTISQLGYQYQSREAAFPYVLSLASTLPDEPLETFPRNHIIASEYCPKKLAETTACLTPDQCILFWVGAPDQTHVLPDTRERWTGAEYAVKAVPSQWMEDWDKATPNPQIRTPEPNPFLPSHIAISTDSKAAASPLLIADNDLGIAYYARCPEYKTPTANIHLHLLSPQVNASARSQVLASLYCLHLIDLLHPTLAAAEEAKLKTLIQTDRSRIHIHIDGFSEKAPLLLQEILHQMPLTPPTKEQFAPLTDLLEKQYSNAQKGLAFAQAKDLLYSLVVSDKKTKKEKLAALKTVSYEDFLLFHKQLFEKTYVEALFTGNLSHKEATEIWFDALQILGKNPFPKADHPITKVAQMPNGPYSITQSTAAQGNAALLLIDGGTFSLQKRAAQEILSIALNEGFFNELRTKQKTGYIAMSDGQEIEKRLFQSFTVQSNSHQPEDLLYRYELFLEEFLQDFSHTISPERFAILQKSAITALQNRCCNLHDKSILWDTLAFRYGADFQFIEQRISALRNLSYEEFSEISNTLLARSNRKRLAILFEGKLAAPFAYESTTALQLSEIAHYAPRPDP
ncbi:MAG: insulinase family protein [Chlamydiia bacterium]|nr:insulinase family protein [Chlamydiia bacterium]